MRKFVVYVLFFALCAYYCNAVAPPETAKPSSQYVPSLDDLYAMLPADLSDEPPTVVVALLVRNKAHILPLFLTYLERLNYPKQQMALWIRSDHNSDTSTELLQLWLDHVADSYHSVDFVHDDSVQRHQNESTANDWPAERFHHLIQLKEAALIYAKKIWADYIFFLDADVLLTHPDSLIHLTSLRLPIVAPMLLSEGLYSNFWCGMTPDYYYQRTDEYQEIYNVNKEGVFPVPMVHSAVLIRMNYQGARYLTFDRERLLEQQQNEVEWAEREGVTPCRPYDGPVDDIIVFARSANCSRIPLFISNKLPHGYIMQPLDVNEGLDVDLQQLVNIRANIVHDQDEVAPVNEYFKEYISYPNKTKLTLDHIYMINLERRPERRVKMEKLFLELGLDVEYVPAVDGKKLSPQQLQDMGVKFLNGYEDPYHHRQMTMGEIGCFLSHYRIWEKVVEREQNEVLVLEDDVRFQPYFKDSATRVLAQMRNVVEYDLLYFGRKRLKEEKEPWVQGAENLVHAGYSYWTLGYVITLKGARKLLAAKPLEKMLPVDEFLPIMFNRHPNKTWSSHFPQRDLLAFSAAPLILFPTHYTGESGYISDTEDSEVTSEINVDSNVQLKSDRELEFRPVLETETATKPFEDELMIDLVDDNDGRSFNQDIYLSKSHEEF
ncbi:glycosyltransferase 25 family member [Anastrepha ludens]|uniref:glycosyltransferase 25 family member n=1 Tax=Anastrepha ludens TaxID=28586 RepID=UPI0023B1D3AA|nr:glycosyltransferase 25 family member [Anastrepha ludens]